MAFSEQGLRAMRAAFFTGTYTNDLNPESESGLTYARIPWKTLDFGKNTGQQTGQGCNPFDRPAPGLLFPTASTAEES